MFTKQYNTQQSSLVLKEYGRNIQKIVEYIKDIKDKTERTRYATTLVELMCQINPNTRDAEESQNKLWDDLYIIAGFDLDVDSPYPMPDKVLLGKKPKRLDYNNNRIRFRHYGRNIELLIEKAISLKNLDDKYGAIIHIGKMMKSFYSSWHKDHLDDRIILQHIQEITKKPLEDSILNRIEAENPFESQNEGRDKRNKSNAKKKPIRKGK